MITITDVRARVETDLDDVTLQRIVDGVQKEIERHAGNETQQIEAFTQLGTDFITLARRAQSITSVAERRSSLSDETLLVEDVDFRVIDPYKIRRLNTDWGEEVVVDYVPESDPNVRDRVALDIAQMDIEFRSFQSESLGDWSGNQTDYSARRSALLAQVREGSGIVI